MRTEGDTENISNASEASFLSSGKVTLLILAVLFFISALSVFSRAGNLRAKKIAPDGPRITFKEAEYDFGTIKYGGDAVHFFVFSNTGETPLVILNVRTSCGCAVPKWPKAPLGSGAKDSLRVEYNTKIKGAFNKTITVQSNAVNAVVELKIMGNVVKIR